MWHKVFIIISICHQIPGELDLFGLAKGKHET